MNDTTMDYLGWSGTLTALLLNLLTISGMDLVSNSYTIILSTMSVIYLYYKIKNEKRKHDEED